MNIYNKINDKGIKGIHQKNLTQKKVVKQEMQNNKKDMRHIENKQQNGKYKSYLLQ